MRDHGPVVVQGHCSPGFEGVREAFVRNFHEGREVGAATAVVVDDEMVVDLWAGHADANRATPWRRDTIVHGMSTTKGMTALIAHRLVERGLLDLDAPVAKYWPEFAEGGKGSLPVRWLLTHQSGLPAPDELQPPGTLLEWDTVTSLLARQRPLWEPGKGFGYHAVTFGFLVGEVIRRAAGKTVGTLIREEIAAPLGVDFELGFGPELDERVAQLLNAPPAPDGVVDIVRAISMAPLGLLSRAYLISMPSPDTDFNARAARAAELPSTNGHTNARALATIYGALARGGCSGAVQLLREDSIEHAIEKQVGGVECVGQTEMHFGLGFTLRCPTATPAGTRAFGHPGFGGSLGLADPDRKLGFGYVMNQLGHSVSEQFVRNVAPQVPPPDPRADNVLRAVYAAL